MASLMQVPLGATSHMFFKVATLLAQIQALW